MLVGGAGINDQSGLPAFLLDEKQAGELSRLPGELEQAQTVKTLHKTKEHATIPGEKRINVGLNWKLNLSVFQIIIASEHALLITPQIGLIGGSKEAQKFWGPT